MRREDLDGLLGDLDQLAGSDIGLGEQPQERALDASLSFRALVPRGKRLVQDPVRPGQVAAHALDHAQAGDQVDAPGVVGRQQGDGARDEAHARLGVLAQVRPAGRGSEALGRPPGQQA